MKKIILINFLFFASFLIVFAQDQKDALRYSQAFYSGNSRSASIGNAIGSLGGNSMSLSINPAGLGVYKGYELSISPGFYFNNTDANYLNNKSSDNDYSLKISNFGFIGSFYPYDYEYKAEGDNSEWESINFGFAYNTLNNFNKNVLFEGINNSSSKLDDIIYSENSGVKTHFGNLAYENLMFYDTIKNEYWTDVSDDKDINLLQKSSNASSGSLGEYVLSIGANYNHKIYIGASFGIQKVYYKEYSEYSEEDFNDSTENFNSFKYSQNLTTKGSGTNFKFGIIIRPIDMVRIGLAMHTPTWLKLEDEYDENLQTSTTDGNFDIYSDKFYEDYELTTPAKFIGSLSLVFKRGFLSMDYEIIDYSFARLRGDNYSYNDENKNITNDYKTVSNLRIGGELNLDIIYLRAGYSYYGSPYENSDFDNNEYISISGGMGVRVDNVFIDFAYINSTQKANYYPYKSFENTFAKLENNNNQMLITLGMKF
ncbi:MAG: hypothetical protein B6I24_03840 [Bacteroidetes bacterium 4572_128]|nr:MAG: hypothetical protein B6I24_03840 [Bacteroidetes bacterium 4572_128]